MSRQTAMAANEETDLYSDADLAAKGDDAALDRLFAALGGSAWGVGFAAADAVGPATDAVAKGFAELLQLFDNGLAVGDVRTELLRATRAAALSGSGQSSTPPDEFEGAHAREPLTLLGETKDRQATLAFTALSEQMRSALWLTEAEGFSITKTAQLLHETHKTTEELVRQARASFRGYYVDAVRRDGLSPSCTSTLDKLAAYVGRSLPAGEVAAVEHHLADCKECRAIVMRLDDLEGRLHAAIPPLPAWTRQQVADVWGGYVPAVAGAAAEPETKKRGGSGALIGLVAVVAAFVIVLLGANVFDSNKSSKNNEAASVTNNAVSTPKAEPVPTTATTAAPAETTTTAAPVETTTTVAPETTTTQALVTTTTAAAPRPTPTTAAPRRTTPTTSTGYTLVNLPPTPIGR